MTAITEAADAFGRELEAGRFGEVTDEQKKLWVNDLSLPWGGLFYCFAETNGERGHDNHRWGQNVDISYQKMNKKQWLWFKANAERYFSKVYLHGDPLHFHCSVYM